MTDPEVQVALSAEPQTGRANDNEGPFSIGQDVWPGISKLIEEAGEILQVCGKLIATGGRTDHWSGVDLARKLEEEMADLRAALDFVLEHNPQLDRIAITNRTFAKCDLFDKWHRHTGGSAKP